MRYRSTGPDYNFWALCVLAMIFAAWLLAQSGCAAFKPASSAGPSVRIYSLLPTGREARELPAWELRRYEAGVGAQVLPLDAAKGFSCVSPGDLELLLKAIIGVN